MSREIKDSQVIPLRSVSPLQSESSTESPHNAVTCAIYSNHPVAFHAIKAALSSDPNLSVSVKSYSSGFRTVGAGRDCILLLDTCSVENWQKSLHDWVTENGHVIALLSPEQQQVNETVQMLSFGVSGILCFSDELKDLPKAIRAVMGGQLWIRRSTLTEYVTQTNALYRKLLSANQVFTSREKEIINLLMQDFSNRQIADSLRISERTIKFHVSNILHKSRLESRKDLRGNVQVESPRPITSLSTYSCANSVLDHEGAVVMRKRSGAT